MPFKKFEFVPGLYTEAAKIDAGNRIIDGNHVRWYKGFPRKIGGTTKLTPATFLGVCRGMDSWTTLLGEKYTALGTNEKLYIESGGEFFDITPITESGTLGTDPFSTTDTLTSVTVTDVGHGRSVGDYVSFSGATPVGGLTINGEYTVTTVIDVDNYTITSPTPATSTATGGGAAVDYEYQLPIGPVNTTAEFGWGAGPWGSSAWGTPRTSNPELTYARTWSVNNYGQDLIASPRDGAIYIWLASGSLTDRAVVIAAAPETNKYVIVSSEDRYLISLGAFDGFESDPMLIRWSSQNDYNDWIPTTINTAGDKRLSDGNLIITGCITRGQIIISTDTTVYAMYPDSEFIFGFKTLGVGGALGPNAMIENNGIVYWWGVDNFYFYDGTIQVLPCDVRSYVIEGLNQLQAYKIYAGVNSEWNEIWWFYTDQNDTENNRYVAFNYVDGTWHYGSWERTAWLDKGIVNNEPVATSPEGYMYYHETGVDDDGMPLDANFTTGNIQLAERNRFIYVKKLIPNFKSLTETATIQVVTQLYPQTNPQLTSEYPVTQSTNYISTRARGDEFSLVVASNVIGGDFWMGNMEIEFIATGAR